MTSKLSDFNTLQYFQIDFTLTLSKLHESGEPLPRDLQIAAFLHGVEETYSQWAFAKRSTIRGKGAGDPLPTVDNLTAELMDESRVNVRAKATALTIKKGGYGQSRGRGNTRGRRGRVRGVGVEEEIKERLTHNAAIVLSSQFYARLFLLCKLAVYSPTRSSSFSSISVSYLSSSGIS